MKGPALIIMTRAPVPGRVKTRLQPRLSPEQCARLHTAFLKDILNMALSIPNFTTFLAYTPQKSHWLFKDIVPEQVKTFPQTGRSLGQKMCNAMRRVGERGYSPVIIVGSDIPLLQPATLYRAIDALGRCDICLGPSLDGGYYITGACQIHEPIFQDIPWSTPNVLDATLDKVRQAGLSLAMLEYYRDIDTYADLELLCKSIEALTGIPGSTIPINTLDYLKESGIQKAPLSGI